MNYKLAEFFRINKNRILRKKPNVLHFDKMVNNHKESNKIICDLIGSNTPSTVGKLGEIELEAIRNFLSLERIKGKSASFQYLDYFKYGDKHEWTVKDTMWKNTGFFPITVSNLEKFCLTYLSILQDLDFFCTAQKLKGWYANKNEDYVINHFLEKGKILDVAVLDPILYYLENHWIKSLENKKVLVIHPFEESILNNYKKKELIYKGLLPSFELITIKAVQSAGETLPPGLNSWFEALDYQKEAMEKKDFDVALIGAGAYGLPLAYHAKKLGKIGIHIGGGLQLYFGILGKRWENNPTLLNIVNEHWTKPRVSETPEGFKKVGDGNYSYW